MYIDVSKAKEVKKNQKKNMQVNYEGNFNFGFKSVTSHHN